MKEGIKMFKNFVKEVAAYAKAGAPHVTPHQYKKRINACMECPHLRKEVDRCGLCGCLVEHKAKWATSSCPDKEVVRWEPVKIGEAGKQVKLKKDDKDNNTETSDEVQPPAE